MLQVGRSCYTQPPSQVFLVFYSIFFFVAGLFSNTPATQSANEMKGAFYSNVMQLPYQFLGIIVVVCWTSFWTLLLVKFIQSTVGFFLSDQTCYKELNVSEIHKRNNEGRVLKQRLVEAAKSGDLQQFKELRKKFAVNFGLKDFNDKTAL